MSLASSLRRAVPVLLLGTFGFAFGQSGVHQPAVSGSAPKAAASSSKSAKANVQLSPSPADAVIGAHLGEWVKEGNAKSGSAAIKRKAAKANVTGVQVQAPAFYAAPFLSLANLTQNTLANPLTGDFNNDGKMDYANVEAGGQVDVLLNPGSFSNLASLTPVSNTSALTKAVGISMAVVADMNGDGNADIVAMDSNNSYIVTWFGKGDGSFADPVYTTVAPGSGASWPAGGLGDIVVADFNGDGKPDVATVEATAYDFTNYKMTISEQTFLNGGDGTLSPGPETDFTSVEDIGPNTGNADVLSKDGKTASGFAMVVGDYGTPNAALGGTYVWVFASKGDGSFTAPTIPTKPLISSIGEPTVVATNLTASFKTSSSVSGASRQRLKTQNSALSAGVATTDLVIVIGDGAVYDAPYTGSGTPASASVLAGNPSNLSGQGGEYPSTPGAFPLATNNGITVADFNGDGFQDVVTTTPGTAYVFLNSGSGSFSFAPAEVAGTDAGHVAAADFDNSGYASLMWVGATLPELGYFQNLGSSDTTQAGLFYSAPAVSGPSTDGGVSHYAVGGAMRVQAAADVNGDGLLDVIATDGSYGYRDGLLISPQADFVLGLNNGAGNGANQKNGFTFTTVISGDDLEKLGSSTFLEPVTAKTSAGTSVFFATYSPYQFYSINLDASGKPGSPQALQFAAAAPACQLYYADAGDVNGDGFTDLVVAYAGDYSCSGGKPGSGTVNSGFFTFLGDGSGNFQAGTFTALGTSLFKVKLAALVKGSKTLSVVAIDSYTPRGGMFGGSSGPSDYHVWLVPGNGDGTFNTANETDIAPEYIASDVFFGDFNLDGLQDVTITTEGQYDTTTESNIPNTSGALLIAGNGDGTVGGGQFVDQGVYPGSGVYADFNGDGKVDLALTQYIGSNDDWVPMLEIFPNLGGGVFGPSYSQLLPPFEYALVRQDPEFEAPVFAGAFSKSGSADLLISHGYGSALYVNLGSPTLQVTANPATATQGASVTLTASLTQGGSGLSTATGSVVFSANGTALGAAVVTDGVATLTTIELPVGTDTVQASYTGNASANAITGQTSVTVTALAPALTITASPSSLSLTAGATGTVVLNLAANATFSGTVSFACSGAPSEASCNVNPTSVTLGANQTGNVAVVIATTAKNNQYQAMNRTGWGEAAGGLSLAGLLCLMIPSRRRIARLIGVWILMLGCGASFLMLSGCGSSGNKYPGTPAGTSTITVTATAGAVTATQTISVTVGTGTGQ